MPAQTLSTQASAIELSYKKKTPALTGGVYCDTSMLPRVGRTCQVTNSTSSVKQLIHSTNPIANRVKNNYIKPNSLLDCQVVDGLLEKYEPLIDTEYIHWFAKRFYILPFDLIHRLAAEAKADGRNPTRLFAFLINKAYNREVNKGTKGTAQM